MYISYILIVDRYYRKIESIKDNIDNSLEITGILLKLKKHEATLRNYEDRFNNFQRMINTIVVAKINGIIKVLKFLSRIVE